MSSATSPFVVAISGTSGSGKSVLCDHLATAMPGRIAVLAQDRFFLEPTDLPPDANFYEHQYLDGQSFVAAFEDLASGSPTEVPELDDRFDRVGTVQIVPSSVLLVEGMSVLRYRAVLESSHLVLYLDPPWDVVRERKRRRDLATRGKSAEVVRLQLAWMEREVLADRSSFGEPATWLSETENRLVEIVVGLIQSKTGS